VSFSVILDNALVQKLFVVSVSNIFIVSVVGLTDTLCMIQKKSAVTDRHKNIIYDLGYLKRSDMKN
jgi:hypothetical protein